MASGVAVCPHGAQGRWLTRQKLGSAAMPASNQGLINHRVRSVDVEDWGVRRSLEEAHRAQR